MFGKRANIGCQDLVLVASVIILTLLPVSSWGLNPSNYKDVIEIDRTGKIVWRISELPARYSNPYDVERLPNGNTLVATVGSGWVYEFNSSGDVVWKLAGSDPCDVERLPNGNTLVVVRNYGQVREYDQEGNVVWSISNLENPRDSERLPNGNTLIVEAGRNRVIEVNPSSEIVWSMEEVLSSGEFLWDVEWLPNGNILLPVFARDSPFPGVGWNIAEINRKGEIVWHSPLIYQLGPMYDFEKLPNGHFLVVDQAYRAVELDGEGQFVKTIYGPDYDQWPRDIEWVPDDNFLMAIVSEMHWQSVITLLAIITAAVWHHAETEFLPLKDDPNSLYLGQIREGFIGAACNVSSRVIC